VPQTQDKPNPDDNNRLAVLATKETHGSVLTSFKFSVGFDLKVSLAWQASIGEELYYITHHLSECYNQEPSWEGVYC
jgi:hypothetical protein